MRKTEVGLASEELGIISSLLAACPLVAIEGVDFRDGIKHESKAA